MAVTDAVLLGSGAFLIAAAVLALIVKMRGKG